MLNYVRNIHSHVLVLNTVLCILSVVSFDTAPWKTNAIKKLELPHRQPLIDIGFKYIRIAIVVKIPIGNHFYQAAAYLPPHFKAGMNRAGDSRLFLIILGIIKAYDRIILRYSFTHPGNGV